jgi:hypothetical protein
MTGLIFGSPTFGTLLAMSPEEIVLKPDDIGGTPPPIQVKIHFPRLGFVVKRLTGE